MDQAMDKIQQNDPETRSPDLVAENLSALKALFPELVTEGPEGAAVNVDVLKALVGDKTVTDAEEKYGLNWHGKRRARQLALTPSTGTLRPCPEDSVDWDTTQNLMIEGDNLEVLKLLQKSYSGKVKLIYIDPPYNTGKDFVYPDNFHDNIRNYLELTGQVEGGRKISSNTEASGRFHTDWLNMMYPRLKLARNLLRDDGVICISIDDGESSNLISICNQVFGEENHLATFVWKARAGKDHTAKIVSVSQEYIICFGKEKSDVSPGKDVRERTGGNFQDELGSYKREQLRQWGTHDRREDRPTMYFPVPAPDGTQVYPVRADGTEGVWRVNRARIAEMLASDSIDFVYEDNVWRLYAKQRDGEKTETAVATLIDDVGTSATGTIELKAIIGEKVFSTTKPTGLIRRLMEFADCRRDDIVVDFFAGSGTTGHSAMAQNAQDGGNRRYILVQLPEPLDLDNKDQNVAAEFCQKLKKPLNIAELTKERLRRAGARINEQLTMNKKKAEGSLFTDHCSLPIDLGFRVFKLDSTNIREWAPKRDDLEGSLLDSIEHLKTDRTETDILYELLLKLGLDLCVPIETRKVAGKDVHSIGGGVLMTCLAQEIAREDVEKLGPGIVEWRAALAPASETTCVFRDSAFADDVAKTNLAAILNQHGIANVRSL